MNITLTREKNMMRDISSEFIALQEPGYELFKISNNILRVNEQVVFPGDHLDTVGWTILDRQQLDGLNLRQLKFKDFGWDKSNLNVDPSKLGRIYALERDVGKTRLFLVWIPDRIVKRLRNQSLHQPLAAHVLFHPPTYELCYRNTPYWRGKCADPRDPHSNACSDDMKDKSIYLRLGVRYLANDFLAIAHHLLAVKDRQPLLMYIVPVADTSDFSDLMKPEELLKALYEVYEFMVRDLKGVIQADRIGHVMLSGYSRSGTHLEAIMKQVNTGSNAHPFFKTNLIQVNAFDINIGQFNQQGVLTASERLKAFTELWSSLLRWRNNVNPKARTFIYTAYPDLAAHGYSRPPQQAPFTRATTLNLESLTWSDTSKKSLRGAPRGQALELYDDLATWGIVHLPVSFFQHYLEPPTDNPRGFTYLPHGHGMFLRKMMLHALAHADPRFYVD